MSPTEVTVAEGSSAIYTVVLDARPASDVVIDVTAGGSPDVTVDTDGATSGNRNTLTFTRANWDRAQTVTLSAAHDADAVNDAASISHAVDASRSAHEYDAANVAGVAVTVTDNDAAGVTVSAMAVTANEGSTATYTVVLNTQPASNVVIGVTAGGSPDVTVDTDGTTSGNRNTLTFTTANWDTAKTVRVSASHDADAVNDTASITHAVVDADSAIEYDGMVVANVSVSVNDDAAVTASETALSVPEGGSADYTVVLDAQPASDVVIEVNSDNTDVTVSSATLTFTTANWSTEQTVRVTAAQDADAANDAASITHAVVDADSANEYDGVAVAAVTVTDETPVEVATVMLPVPSQTSTPTVEPTPVPSPAPTQTPTPTPASMPSVTEDGGGAGASWVWALIIVLLSLAAIGGAIGIRRRRRQHPTA